MVIAIAPTVEAKATSRVVGSSVPRVDALEKATGTALYTGDLKLPGLLHGKVLRSPHAHARILSIDTSKAERLPGVKAVVTGKDFLALFGPAIADQPIFATDKVRYPQEPLAAVAALSEEVAREALELIQVKYEPLPAVFSAEEAIQEGAALVHEDHGVYKREPAATPFVPGTNICYRFQQRKGDVEKGFTQSDYVFEDVFRSHLVQHAALEPHVAVAQVDPTAKVTVWTPNDAPYRCRKALAEAFNIPMNRVRVQGPYQGGGFGGKGGLHAEVFAVALALRTQNRPVRVEYTREEVSTATLTRHPCTIWIKTGVTKEGRLLAREMRLLWDTGAYAEKGPTICRQGGFAAAGPYQIPNVKIHSDCVYTNHVVAGAMRGYGVPQTSWATECQMDIIAQSLGLDPLELRLKNALREGDEAPWGERMFSVGVVECLQRAAAALDWEHREGGPLRGKGIACMVKATNTPSGASVFLRLNEDGTATVLASSMELGQGMRTVLAQFAAEELGVPLSCVSVVAPDTDVTPYDMATTSSRSTFHGGNAIRLAAQEVKQQLFQIAAAALEANPEDLEVRDGRVTVKGLPEKGLSIAEVIRHRWGSRGGNILGQGNYLPQGTTGLDANGLGARPSTFWMYAAQGAEVEVDPETGQVCLLRMTAAHDVGKAINPLGCTAQIEGGLSMGIGGIFYEEMLLGKDGQVLNPTFLDYRLPTALDMSPIIPIIVEEPHRDGPYGAKGIGEPALACTAAAIANAFSEATGVRIKDLPLTPERVQRALAEAQGKGG